MLLQHATSEDVFRCSAATFVQGVLLSANIKSLTIIGPCKYSPGSTCYSVIPGSFTSVNVDLIIISLSKELMAKHLDPFLRKEPFVSVSLASLNTSAVVPKQRLPRGF
ncbi:unnamed protein product [Somion occarium]|uniref:Uncharacterized protein n=1 Tax=Somion occarium TaxID=3059160 RepID=A0ABP1DEA8_9APHY